MLVTVGRRLDVLLVGGVVVAAVVGFFSPLAVAAVLALVLLLVALVLGVRRVEGRSDALRPLPVFAAGMTVLVVGLVRELGPVGGIGVAVGLVLLALLLGGDVT